MGLQSGSIAQRVNDFNHADSLRVTQGFLVESYFVARYIHFGCRTHKGYMMLSMECVPGGSVPSVRRLRVWGCKAYVLVPARLAQRLGGHSLDWIFCILSVTPRIRLVGLSICQSKKRR